MNFNLLSGLILLSLWANCAGEQPEPDFVLGHPDGPYNYKQIIAMCPDTSVSFSEKIPTIGNQTAPIKVEPKTDGERNKFTCTMYNPARNDEACATFVSAVCTRPSERRMIIKVIPSTSIVNIGDNVTITVKVKTFQDGNTRVSLQNYYASRSPLIRIAGKAGIEENEYNHTVKNIRTGQVLRFRVTHTVQSTGEIFQKTVNARIMVADCRGQTLPSPTKDGLLYTFPMVSSTFSSHAAKVSSQEKCPETGQPLAEVYCLGNNHTNFRFGNLTEYPCVEKVTIRPTLTVRDIWTIPNTQSAETTFEPILNLTRIGDKRFTPLKNHDTTVVPEDVPIFFREEIATKQSNFWNITNTETAEKASEKLLILTKIGGAFTPTKSDSTSVTPEDVLVRFSENIETMHIKITRKTIENVAEAADLMNLHPGKSKHRMAVVASLEKLAAHVHLNHSEIWKTSFKSLSMQIFAIPHSGMDEHWRAHLGTERAIVDVSLPMEALKAASEHNKDSSSNAFLLFFNNRRWLPDSENFVVDQVLTANIGNFSVTNLKNPFSFQLNQLDGRPSSELPSLNERHLLYQRCGYFNESQGIWAFDGCWMVRDSSSKATTCACNHMTSFAVVVLSVPLPPNEPLRVVGKVGCALSIAGLTIMIIIHIADSKLRQKMVTHVHLHLTINMLIAYLTFLLGVERPRPFIPCIVVSSIIHFTLLSAWGWMTVECYVMYRRLVKVFRTTPGHFVRNISVLIYTSSAFLVGSAIGISLGLDKKHLEGWHPHPNNGGNMHSSYVSGRFCWLSGVVHYTAFLAPVAILFSINTVVYFFIIKAVTWGRKTVNSTVKKSLKTDLCRCIAISIILGLAWCFVIPLNTVGNPTTKEVFSWLFSITNSLQGFLIFIFFCVKRDNIKKTWWGPIQGTVRRTTRRRRGAEENAS